MALPITVAVRSDDGLLRDGLIGILRTSPLVVITEHASEAAVVLLDARTRDVLTLCAAMVVAGSAVLLVAAPEDDGWGSHALAAGARGILPGSARAEVILEAVQVIGGGGMWAPRRVMAACIEHLARVPVLDMSCHSLLEQRLSEREREVFRYAATGLANRELANRLAISEATVKVHLTRIFQKLGVHGRAELAAAYHGVIRRSADRA